VDAGARRRYAAGVSESRGFESTLRRELDKMQKHNGTYDAIVVGAGAGGCAAAYALVSAGLKVALVEKGGEVPVQENLALNQLAYQEKFKNKEPWRNTKGKTFHPEEYFNLGGKTRWYGGGMLRFEENEFQGGAQRGLADWPISYAELAPYYAQVEKLMNFQTFEVENDLQEILRKLKNADANWETRKFPLAVNTSLVEKHQKLAGTVDEFSLIANNRENGVSAFLNKVKASGHLDVYAGKAVDELLADGDDMRCIAGVRLVDGLEIYAKNTILAAGALHSPRLLQRYCDSSEWTKNLPVYKQIGRHLKLHFFTSVIAMSPTKKTDFIRKTALILNAKYPGSRVEPLSFNAASITYMMPRFMPGFIKRKIGAQGYVFLVQTEDASHPDNRVTAESVATNGYPVMDYEDKRSPKALQEHQNAVKNFRTSLKVSGYKTLARRIGQQVTAHACGTLRAGSDASNSVVGANGLVHGMQNIYVADASIFPNSGRLTPSLTVFAWGLRLGDLISKK
jgi:choline dehydrogenase-like flavoprotein